MTGSLAYTESLREGSLTLDLAWLFAGFLALLVLAAGFIAARRFLLERGGGTVECGLRKGTGSWRLGVVSYQQDELHWFSAFGITSRADEAFRRRDLAVVSRRDPDPGEEATLGPDRVIVECSLADGETVELALASSALTGLLAWLEAAPPGQHLYPLTLWPLSTRGEVSEPAVAWPWRPVGSPGRVTPKINSAGPLNAGHPASIARRRARHWPAC